MSENQIYGVTEERLSLMIEDATRLARNGLLSEHRSEGFGRLCALIAVRDGEIPESVRFEVAEKLNKGKKP